MNPRSILPPLGVGRTAFDTEVPGLAEAVKEQNMTTDTEWGEWQVHDGGPCPIPDAKAGEYEVEFRISMPGVITVSDCDANELLWSHRPGGGGDIISYRLRKSQ